MGEEIRSSQFYRQDYSDFYRKLENETLTLKRLLEHNAFGKSQALCGIEQEAWITNQHYYPAPENQFLLDEIASDLLSPELAQFNIELNVHPQQIAGRGLRIMHDELSALWKKCERKLQEKNHKLLMVGILPTVRDQELVVENMSRMNRYQALNEQVLKQRKGRPLSLNIVGVEHLKSEHRDVMLESAATSYQIHRQIPAEQGARYYNASIIISAPMVALCANSPFLFGRALWDETRIPLFEQAVEAGGYGDAAHGPIRRVTFGTAYVQQSIFELFQENLDHYPVLLPVPLNDKDDSLPYLRMHNGTIWRWNRPLLGVNEAGEPHIRIEHRVISAGPTIVDEIANTAFFLGLQEFYANQKDALESSLVFSDAKHNFYNAAQHGLNAKIKWLDGKKQPILHLLATELLANAKQGLKMLAMDNNDIRDYLAVIEARLAKRQTGAEWQKNYVKKHACHMNQLAEKYWELQKFGQPVHDWTLE
ncbi:MAG TPA: glutamate--cysteine ligase [Gammaproteobacteria bacterium]|nr:glutamate--cysteine ligase [Gammaproteobacteria bacterium]